MSNHSRQSEARVQGGPTSSSGSLQPLSGLMVAFRQSRDGTFAWFDPALEELAGVSAARWGQRPDDFWELVHEEDRVWLRGHLAGATEASGWVNARYRLRHGVTGQVCHVLECRRLVEKQGEQPGLFEGFWLDQTGLVRAERRLAAATGKEILAHLVAGYVHDLNNVFAGISSLAQLSMLETNPAESAGGNPEMMKASLRRAGQLLEDLGRLVQPGRARPRYHDLQELCESALRLMRPGVPRRIGLEQGRREVALPVYLDGAGFRQVVFNLVFNAVAAMGGEGRVLLETSRWETIPAELVGAGMDARGPLGCLTVTDTGRGVVPGDESRVFERCYSTRVGGGGMGLGLAYVRDYVVAHGGAVTVESVAEGGTKVWVWLPLTDFGEDERGHAGPGVVSRRVLLAGPAGRAGEDLAAGLRAEGWEVVWAKRDAELTLAAGDESYAAVVLLSGLGRERVEGFVGGVRQQKTPLKIVWVREVEGAELSQPLLEQVDHCVYWMEGVEGAGERLGVRLKESAGMDPKLPGGAG